MTYQFTPPSLNNYQKYKPQTNTTAAAIQNIPGVGKSTGYRGALPQNTQNIQRERQETPLETYQKVLKDKIAQTTAVTDKAKGQVRTKNGFAYKYGIKNFSSQQKQPQQYTAVSAGRTRGAWGGFQNGRIPVQALKPIAQGHYLRADAANAFASMNAAFKRAFGRNIAVTSSYRSYAAQVGLTRTRAAFAARPGTSNHGWGVALDLGGGINRHGTAEHNWMRQYAPQFGFGSLSGAMYRKEPWHWEFRG